MKRTVLILGAGASAPFNFPTGDALKQTVLKELHEYGSDSCAPDLIALGHTEAELALFRERFRLSQVPTIDAFIQGNEELELLGKRVIAAILLRAEASNRDRLFDHPDWYRRLFLAVKDHPELNRDTLSIITFNYDRSLEHYLLIALANSNSKLCQEDVDTKVDNLGILHFYGHLGRLTPSKTSKAYSTYDRGNISIAAETIHLIQRDQKTTENAEAAAKMCLGAECIMFLGFGFHSENLLPLKAKDWENDGSVVVYATAKGLGNLERMEAASSIGAKVRWDRWTFRVSFRNINWLSQRLGDYARAS